MNNILFWVLMYLFVGCVYTTIWWIFSWKEAIQTEINVMERYVDTITDDMLRVALIIDMVINIVIWPFNVANVIIVIVKIIRR